MKLEKSIKVKYEDLPTYKQGGSPEFNYCRELVKKGVNPDQEITFYHGEKKSLTFKSIRAGSMMHMDGLRIYKKDPTQKASEHAET